MEYGKSTLTKMLKREFPQFNVVSFEAVRNGFMKSQPELDMGNRSSVARREILPQYIVEFAEWNERMTGNPTVVEGSFAKVEEVCRLVRDEDVVVCLGYGEMILAEVAKCAISKAGAGSYLSDRSEAEFVEHFYDLADDDKENREFCERSKVSYFVTVEGREEVLRGVVEYIMGRMGA